MTISTSTGSAGAARVCGRGQSLAAFRHVFGWAARIYRARQVTHALARLDEHELRDIGLTRQDLRDVSGLPLDADPSPMLHQRARERRRRR